MPEGLITNVRAPSGHFLSKLDYHCGSKLGSDFWGDRSTGAEFEPPPLTKVLLCAHNTSDTLFW